MIVQAKQQNQPHRECLYAWYPEAINETGSSTSLNPRDIYLHNGLDKDLLEQKSSTNGCKNNRNIYIYMRYREQKKNFIFFLPLLCVCVCSDS